MQKQIIPKYGDERTDAWKRIPMNDAANAFHSNDARSDKAWSRLRESQMFVSDQPAKCRRAGTLDSSGQ
ncbi:hypothetical protein [Bradyrhizobium cenepequi]|uniref:hypothetical protein n=1 Tax=Bradyrhizobium cenepequi TaxID=2821403 RepID=UPI001CE3A835|nr:hypothetical protein [Bradyrhizobium cenepequi]MCA6105748.1 hypothetical protein [Bradyrhizobium cenepequi]